MLSRTQFILIRLGAPAATLGFVLLAGWLLQRLAVAGIAGCALAFAVDALVWPGTGGGSYREYLKVHGVPVPPPSRFWATTGQLIVVGVAALIFGVVSHVAGRAPDESRWRSAAIVVWVLVPTMTLAYLFSARDARRELKSAGDGSRRSAGTGERES